jgi:hypothetical protein
MQQINQIEAKDITRLDGLQLVRLLHTLLCAEARTRNITSTGIHVPFEINVKDGGSDGQWDGEIEVNDFIPSKLTFFQSKAQLLGPTGCADEIHKEDSKELKSQVKTVLEAGGAYVFFCSHPYNKKLIGDRIAKAREALKAAGRRSWKKDKLHFLDANLIARWVNQHSAAFAYVCRCTGIWQAVAFRDYRHWRDDQLFEYDFQSNEQLQGFISEIRATLSDSRGIARITGPSGLGKTRLGFEVFNARSNGDGEKIRETLAASVVYLDMQIHGQQTLGWVDQLTLGRYSGVIVVDNCSRQDHYNLERMVQHQDCRLSLLTVDYVPENSVGDSALQVSLTPEIMRDVVPRILSTVPGLKDQLGEAGIQRVSEFAHGFPQIAILTAKAGHALDLKTLNQQGALANRLLWGWDAEDPRAKEIIRCLAPFTEIGRSGKFSSQLTFVRDQLCGGLNDYDFNRLTRRFFDNRVIQEVGDFLQVVPPPLAAALAAEWIEDVPDQDFQDLLPKINECGLIDSFCKRLRQLDFSPRAQALCEKLMGPTGPFSVAEVLNSEAGSKVFRSLSEVNPLAAVECLYRVTNRWTSEDFAQLSSGRRNLVWALEKLVWDPAFFTRAARVLMGFAAGETETLANNATQQFCQLYHIFLPGTGCPIMDRFKVIEEGLLKDEGKIKDVCVKALSAALSADRFMRTGGSEQTGTQLPKSDYVPTNGEILEYWRKAFMILIGLIREGSDISTKARDALGSKLGAILTCVLVNELEEEFKLTSEGLSCFWPTAREEIKRILDYQSGIAQKQREVIERWLGYVTPTDLRNRLINTIATPGWHHADDKDGNLIDLSEANAVQLAEHFHQTGENWINHIDALLQGEQQQTWQFGRRCLELAPEPEKLFNTCLQAYSSLDRAVRNPQLLRGMINLWKGSPVASKILDRIAENPDLRIDLLIPLTTACATSVADFERVASLTKSGALTAESIGAFAFGSITLEFEVSAFLAALTALKNQVPETAPLILYVAFMFCHNNPVTFEALRGLLADLVVTPYVIKSMKSSQIGHAWDMCLEFLLQKPDEGFVQRISQSLVGTIVSNPGVAYLDSYIPKIVGLLLRDHPKLAWPAFSAALREENGEIRFSIIELLSRKGRIGDSGTPLWQLPTQELKAWAEQNKDLLPFFLGSVPLYKIEKLDSTLPAGETQDVGSDSNKTARPIQVLGETLIGPASDEHYVWHSHAKILLDLCGKDELLDCLHSNIFSFGSTGSRVPYLEKRMALVADLAKAENPDFKEIAESLATSLREEIRREEKWDVQRAAGIYVR